MKNITIRLIIFHLCVVTLLLAMAAVTPVYAKAPEWVSELIFPAPQQVSAPLAMAIDSERQRYYVVDSQKGKLLSYAGDGAALADFDAAGALQHPTDMSFARPGKLWVVERERNCLLYIDMSSQQVREFSPVTSSGKHIFIGHIACDSDHRLYVADRFSGRIYALDDNLQVVYAFAPHSGGHFIDFKIVGKQLWALEREQQAVYQFTLDGKQQQRITLDRPLRFPYSIAVDKTRQLYILDRASAKIFHFTTAGKYVAQFGQKGSRRGQLNYAAQLMFDWQQRLCVVNQGNDLIEVFSQQHQ
ncbi:MAG: NHL repeat-containing protein [Desulfuromonas sp.]|nr:NHL repeat-containing protein [Desulfuromonas sp.]